MPVTEDLTRNGALDYRSGVALDALLSSAVADGTVVGAIMMAGKADELLYQGVFGSRDRELGMKATTADVYMLASLTKTVTAVAAMQLVERGKLGLDDPLGSLVPEFTDPQVLEGFQADGTRSQEPNQRFPLHPTPLGPRQNMEIQHRLRVDRKSHRGGHRLHARYLSAGQYLRAVAHERYGLRHFAAAQWSRFHHV
jgi:hypothetical protein